MPTSPQAERVCFGIFEADLRAGELYRQGRRIKLHQQSFQVLALLLDHAGEVVTRQELQRKLWATDTFVNFDIGLNSAVRKLRGALNDSAESPRYVETLPRRGYRFVAPVGSARNFVGEPEAETSGAGIAVIENAAVERETQRVSFWTRHSGVITAVTLGLLVLVASLTVWNRRQGTLAEAAPFRVHSIAVLPFENLSGDPSQEYFVDGMTDALTTNLAQINSLKVISRTSLMRYKGTRKPVPEIARELNVDAIVTGAVIRSGDRMRADIQLVEAATDRHVWAQAYERNIGEVLSLQAEIARSVANEIHAKLTPEEQARLRADSIDPQTYELYAKGRYFWNRLTDDSILKGIAYFEQAIQRQPRFAPAYASMAEAYAMRRDITPVEAFSRAKAAAVSALGLDDTLAEAHNALAESLFSYDWNWAGAEKEFQRALELNPNYATAHQWYGQFQKAVGRSNWSDEVRRAAELDPLAPYFAGGGWYLERGEYDLALDLIRKKLELDPSLPYFYNQLGRIYTQKGSYVEAIQSFHRAIELSGGAPAQSLSQLGYAYGMSGKRAEAIEILRQLELLSKQRYVPRYAIAVVYVGLGERDLAFDWLDKAVSMHDPALVMLNRPGEMDSLRSDQRFTELKHRVGLPE
jgi:TolB-like protein/DNA-binding winged helix-turn-helix (wHTH) protein/Tfp pilus assembly protein PilF